MQLQVGDRYTDESGEWEAVSRPVSYRGGKSVRARVQVPGRPDTEREEPGKRISESRSAAHERHRAALAAPPYLRLSYLVRSILGVR
jgi:hypothetical protein